MSRKPKSPIVWMHDVGPFASGTADNTITLNHIYCPGVGARIFQWGVTYTAAGTGELNPVLNLVERGKEPSTGAYGNNLSQGLTLNLDAAADTQTSVVGPAIEPGSAGKGTTLGEHIDMRVDFTAAADTFATTDASFEVWTLWQL